MCGTTGLASRSRPRSLGRLTGVLVAVAGLTGSVAAQDAEYRLAPGDRVALSVYGQAELSGEFGIGGGGSLLLPLVGEVPISALTLSEAQRAITHRLADGFLQQPLVSLRITEMRPIYVLGDVRNPGSYPFRYGASVLSGIALAGGYGVPEQVQTSLRTEFLAAEERVRVLEASRRLFLVRRARLEAQQGDRAAFEPPFDPQNGPELVRLVKEERSILAIQRDALAQAVEQLRAQKPRIEAEIAGVRAQRTAEETQLKLIQDHIEDYKTLMSNGLARRYQGIEFQREEARNKGAIARMNSDLARLDLALGDLELRIQEARSTYLRKVMADLQDVTTRLIEIETQLPAAREIREARLQSGGALTAFGVGFRRKVFITRVRNGTTEILEAADGTSLAPGDIVDIRRVVADRIAQADNSSPLPAGEEGARRHLSARHP
jgi:polysaccharide export outer membrane protein